MLCTKNLTSSYKDVPEEWVWMFYCSLWNESFDGETYTIHSIFRKERTPSMKIYFRNERYFFKDYGNGWSGDAIEMVKYLYSSRGEMISFREATSIIVREYNNWVLTSESCSLKLSDFKRERCYTVTHETRKWNELDMKFWISHYISSKILQQFNVAPLEWFTMKEGDNEFTIKGDYIYGYFSTRGELFKIYQPTVAKRKFIFVKDYLQGEDQLRGHPFLLIQAGLKDIMSFSTMNLRIDSIAPHSENTMIHSAKMRSFLREYKQVLIMLDNDEAGHKATERYIKAYPQIKPVYHMVEGCKDVAEIVPKKRKNSIQYFVPLIDRVLCKKVMKEQGLPTLWDNL